MANLPAYAPQLEDNIQIVDKPEQPVFQDPGGIMTNISKELHAESQRLLSELRQCVGENKTNMVKVESVFQQMVDTLVKETYCWIDVISPSVNVGETDSVIKNLTQLLRERLLMVARGFYPFFPGNGDLAGKVLSTNGLTQEYESSVRYAGDVAYNSLPAIFSALGYQVGADQIEKSLDAANFTHGVEVVLDILSRWRYHVPDNSTMLKLKDQALISQALKPNGVIYNYLETKQGHENFVNYEADYLYDFAADLERSKSSDLVNESEVEILARTANATWKVQLPRAYFENKPKRIESGFEDRDYDVFDLMLINVVNDTMGELIAQGKSVQEAEKIAIWIAASILMKDIVELRKARKRHIEAEKDKKVQEMFAV
jgi:hypothetical protein